MLTCSKCGTTEIEDRFPICPHCGNSLRYERMMSKRDEQLGIREQICTSCGSRMRPKPSSHCSVLIAILLLMLWIIPGLLYIGYCMAKSKPVCSVCGSEYVVPLNSPTARAILAARGDD